MVDVIGDKRALRARVWEWRRAGERVAFVPTMGALHEGHLSLMRAALEDADHLVVSIFVNPTQFDRAEDLDSYPSDLEADLALLEQVGCELLFTTSKEAMYEADFSTWVVPEGSLVGSLCGRTRGSHFRGVTTVVSKLFHIVGADCAFFGEKDYQQLAIIRRMVRDLDFPIEVKSVATVRESDGLALSSRNRLLTPENRQAALAVPRSLAWARQRFVQGERDAGALLGGMRERLEAAGGRPDYIEAVDGESLAPVAVLEESAVVALAVFFGEVRLIDNQVLGKDFPVDMGELS